MNRLDSASGGGRDGAIARALEAGGARRLFLMRHSEAAYGGADFERPLTARGRQLAAAQGGIIAQQYGNIDLAIVSGAQRTRQTLEALKSVGVNFSAVQYCDDLYAAGPGWVLDQVIHEVDDSVHTLLVLFHQMSVGALAAILTAPSERDKLGWGFPVATFATGVTSSSWHNLKQWQHVASYQPAT